MNPSTSPRGGRRCSRTRLGLGVAVAEPGIVGGDEVEAVREQRDEIAEQVGRRRETVEQEDRRRARISRLPVEDGDAVHGDGAAEDR